VSSHVTKGLAPSITCTYFLTGERDLLIDDNVSFSGRLRRLRPGCLQFPDTTTRQTLTYCIFVLGLRGISYIFYFLNLERVALTKELGCAVIMDADECFRALVRCHADHACRNATTQTAENLGITTMDDLCGPWIAS
jgi:hypothetical protein